MSSLIPRQTKRSFFDHSLVDFSSGTYYEELVTTAPTDPLYTQRSQLTLAQGGNYAPAVVLNSGDSRTYTNTSTGCFWSIPNPTWTALTTDGAATIKGMALFKRAGASPAGTDFFVVYNHLSSPYTPNGANFTIVVPSTGIIEIP